MSFTIAALYHFVEQPLDKLPNIQNKLLAIGRLNNIKGTLLIAPEGINGTISGKENEIQEILNAIQLTIGVNKINWKRASYNENPFYRFKVKIKKEIVTLGQNSKQVASRTGKYVQPKDWNALIDDPTVTVIDTRNQYETSIGQFPGALDPKTENFRDFPNFVQKQLSHDKKKKIAMYCTGGIRCEKASNYLINNGFEQVYQLEGGILQYLEDQPTAENRWQGDCFVFDNRVSVDKSLKKGSYDQCFACRSPITTRDKQHPHYQAGISCHHCFEKTTEQQKQRFKQRQVQQTLAKKRGRHHIGA